MSETRNEGMTGFECLFMMIGFLVAFLLLVVLTSECKDLNRRVQALEVTGTAARGPQCTALGKSWKPREDGECYVEDMPK